MVIRWPDEPIVRAKCIDCPADPKPASSTTSPAPIPKRAIRTPASFEPIVCALRFIPRTSSGSRGGSLVKIFEPI